MIVFFDTSALVKLFVAEESSAEMRQLSLQANVFSVSRVAWAEAMAAFARRVREQPTDAEPIETARGHMRTSWRNFAVVDVTQPLVELAGEYADIFALRGYDSIQLASARTVQQAIDDVLHFACFDARLCKAAGALGMQVHGL